MPRKLPQFEAQQPVALERTGQRQLVHLGNREAKAGIIRLIAEQNHRAMAARRSRSERVLHQRGADAELAARAIDRERAEHQRGTASGIDMPQPHGADQAALVDRRKRQTFRRTAAIAQPLAGARIPAHAKAGVKQSFARRHIRGALGANRKRSSAVSGGNQSDEGLGHGGPAPAPSAVRKAVRAERRS